MNLPANPALDFFQPSGAKAPFRRLRSFFVAVLALAVSGCGYNTIPTLEEQANAKWSDVQNQYQRRADLIPNLVATVQGYAKKRRKC
jgi:LemA protein